MPRPGMNSRLMALALVAVPGVVSGQGGQTAPFAGEISEFAISDKVRMPAPCGVVFVGSSSIKLWVGLERDFPGLAIVQRGFGGSQTEHANRYFDELVARYRPAQIVLYEGENDLDAGKDPTTVESDLKAFMGRKREALGATPVYFISVKPSPARWSQFARQSALNAAVRSAAARTPDLVYVDIVQPMLGGADTPRPELFIDDSLHMNARGYAIWRDTLVKALDRAEASTAPNCPAGSR